MRSSPLLPAACALLVSCAVPKQLLSDPDDLADYRAYRAAAREGARLESAQHYLERHPRGVWADEVRSAFDREEARWFEAAKQSRARARDYVVDLPQGPHADAAQALLAMYAQHDTDIDTLVLLAKTRQTAAALELESAQRRRLGELVLEELSVLLEPTTWGARLDDPPGTLERALLGSPRTWPGGTPSLRQDEVFFVVRAPAGSQDRMVPLRLRLQLSRGRVAEGWIEGEDLFVRWTEAAEARPLVVADGGDRAIAAATVAEIISGAVEARLPASRCAVPAEEHDVLTRTCGGWVVRVQMSPRAGGRDVVYVRGPQVGRAAPLGIR